jgi:hypothetical protein
MNWWKRRTYNLIGIVLEDPNASNNNLVIRALDNGNNGQRYESGACSECEHHRELVKFDSASKGWN